MLIGAHNHARLIAAAAHAIDESRDAMEHARALVEETRVIASNACRQIEQTRESLRLLDVALARQFRPVPGNFDVPRRRPATAGACHPPSF